MINIENIEDDDDDDDDDDECFEWCLVRYLHSEDRHPARIRKVYKDFAKKLDFKNVKFPVKIRDIHKIDKKSILSSLVFLAMKIKKNLIYVSQKNIYMLGCVY